VAFALAQLGHPYLWGGSGPLAYDWSGLTAKAWAAAGISLLHYTVDQMHEGRPLPPALAAAGDLVLIPGSDPPGPGLAGHVGIYLGDGLVVSAVDPQLGVAVQSWQVFVSGGLDAVVDPAPGR
jgi:cell wall-associated NlpC family hydrolase